MMKQTWAEDSILFRKTNLDFRILENNRLHFMFLNTCEELEKIIEDGQTPQEELFMCLIKMLDEIERREGDFYG